MDTVNVNHPSIAFVMVARTVFALAISPPCANVSLRHSRGRSLTARRKGEPRGPTSRWRRKPTPKNPCSRSLQPGCRIATLDPTNGLAIEDTTIASDGSLGPLAKSLPDIIKPADRHLGRRRNRSRPCCCYAQAPCGLQSRVQFLDTESSPPRRRRGGPDMGDSPGSISCRCGRSRHGRPRRWPGP